MISAKDKITQRLQQEYYQTLSVADLSTMLNNASDARKQLFLDHLLSGRTKEAGDIIKEALERLAKQKASAEADRILLENTLSEADLLRLIK